MRRGAQFDSFSFAAAAAAAAPWVIIVVLHKCIQMVHLSVTMAATDLLFDIPISSSSSSKWELEWDRFRATRTPSITV